MKKKYLVYLIFGLVSPFHNLTAQNRIIDSLNLSLKIAKQDSTKAQIYVMLAEKFKDINRDTIIPLSLKALELLDKLPINIYIKSNERTKASARNLIGLGYFKTGNMSKSIEYYNLSLKIYEEIEDQSGIANVLLSMGGTFSFLGNKSKALEYDLKGLKIFESLKNKSAIAAGLNNIGAIYKDLGENNKALEFYFKSLSIREEIKDEAGIATSLSNIGFIYQNNGDQNKAIEYNLKSLKIREKLEDKSGIGTSLNNIANIYDRQDSMIKALDFYNRSLKIRTEIGDKLGIAYTLNNIGNFLGNQGDRIQELEYYNKSLNIFEQINYKKGIAGTLNNIASCYKTNGNHIKTLEFLEKALKIHEDIGEKKGISISLNNIAVIYHENNNKSKALEYFNRSLKISEETGNKLGASTSLCYLSKVYFQEKKFNEAKDFGKNALKLGQQLQYPKEIKNATRLLYLIYIKTQDTDSASSYISMLLNILKSSLSKNYSSLSEKEKELLFASMEQDYMLYFDFTSSYKNKIPNLTDTSYNISLQNKGLTLKSTTAMRNTIMNSGDSTLIENYKDWRETKNKISKLYQSGQDTKELDNKANKLEKELVKKSNIFRDFNKAKNINWEQVQKGLKKNEAAIEFVHFRSEIDTLNPIIYAALIVKPGSEHPEMIRLCTEADLEKILGTFQGNNFNFVNKVYGTKKEAQTALYEKTWKPLEQSLKGVKNVYYSPSGLLHKISFAAISKRNNTYLCDNYKLHQQSSTGKVALPDNINYSSEDEFMLAGGVKYNSTKTTNEIWKYLPGTLSETQNIEKLLTANKHKTNYLVSEEANEESFKKNISSANVLHIATHGFFFPDPEVEREKLKKANETVSKTVIASGTKQSVPKDSVAAIGKTNDIAFRGTTNYANWSFVNNKNPLMRSGLVLANANDVWERDPLAEGEDGILTAQEVSNLDLRKTKLVVLSACETGLGDIKGSEGVYGLQRAFKMAGVKYIIMSLWQVPDKETSEFMTTFYDKLIKIKDIKKAFNDTQKEMRKKYDPYFWGAFVLIE